jgi:glycosyltransferase involved in cell wall biosynthesis
LKHARVAVVSPLLSAGGGSEACAMWIIEALKERYDVTVITGQPVRFSELNSFYNTSLKADEISVEVVPAPFLLRGMRGLTALRGYRLARYSKKLSSYFDIMFSTYGFMDFGKPGIQYILDPNFNEQLLRMLNPSPQRWKSWFYKDSLVRKLYLKLGDRLAGFSAKDTKGNMTLVDSDWTGGFVQEVFGLDTITVYPPVPAKYPSVPWVEREDGFVCIGRIVPEKQIERTIEIVRRLRSEFPSLHLHILGKIGDRTYGNFLKALVSKNRQWLFLDGDVSWEQKAELISKHRFGIHGKENEPFGIVVAEMADAGCLVWVPDSGGQREIVDHKHLNYANVADAVDKISRVILDADLRDTLKNHLRERSKRFTVARYQAEIRRVVGQALDQLPSQS